MHLFTYNLLHSIQGKGLLMTMFAKIRWTDVNGWKNLVQKIGFKQNVRKLVKSVLMKVRFGVTLFNNAKVLIIHLGQNRSPIFWYVVLILNVVEHFAKRIIILHGCPFEGWPNGAWPSKPFLPKREGRLCPVRSALQPMQDFNFYFMMFYYIISTTYQKIGDLFWPVIFLNFRTVWM